MPTNDERNRLEALRGYNILDTPPEENFDRVTRIVKKIFNVPAVAIAFIDTRRHWVKSKQGLLHDQAPRETMFCDDVVVLDRPILITDATVDHRYCQHLLVSGPEGVRFYAGVPLRSRDGYPIGTLCCLDYKPRSFGTREIEILQDLSHMVTDVLELRILAATDHLTGALDRRAFRKAAEHHIEAALRLGKPLSLILFDVDHFKRINDTYGHAIGDAVLENVVKACRAIMAANAYLGRLGGEEFALALPNHTLDEAMALAERLRIGVKQLATLGDKGSASVTISLGVTTLSHAARSLDELLSQADAAVYRAKAGGRNLSVDATQWALPSNRWG